MTDSVDVMIGVVSGKVIARWADPLAQIEFDAPNAYKVGLALSHAALKAYKGSKRTNKDLAAIEGELAETRVTITGTQRAMLVATCAHIIRQLTDEKKTPVYIALHCVDAVLRETAR